MFVERVGAYRHFGNFITALGNGMHLDKQVRVPIPTNELLATSRPARDRVHRGATGLQVQPLSTTPPRCRFAFPALSWISIKGFPSMARALCFDQAHVHFSPCSKCKEGGDDKMHARSLEFTFWSILATFFSELSEPRCPTRRCPRRRVKPSHPNASSRPPP